MPLEDRDLYFHPCVTLVWIHLLLKLNGKEHLQMVARGPASAQVPRTSRSLPELGLADYSVLFRTISGTLRTSLDFLRGLLSACSWLEIQESPTVY